MKASICIAQSASSHADGTTSILRGWITNLSVPKNQAFPLNFNLCVVVSFEREVGDPEEMEFDIRFVGEDGKPAATIAQKTMTFPKDLSDYRYLQSFILQIQGVGRSLFVLRLNKQTKAESVLHVRHTD
ncbi:MAG: hypothetical protein HY286_17345 [Planctomycetes bacterium]|nr:hypothetical protein [Planctomycetota bacterium]